MLRIVNIWDLNTDLENKLKIERQQNHQTKLNLEREAREQTDLKEKSVQEINLKLSSLQQHYKLLKSQHEDFIDECSTAKAKQLKEVSALQSKVKLLESKNDYVDKQMAKDIDLWKVINYSVFLPLDFQLKVDFFHFRQSIINY